MDKQIEKSKPVTRDFLKAEINKGILKAVALSVAVMAIMLSIFANSINTTVDAKITAATAPLKVHMEYMTKRMDTMESDIAAIKAAVVK